MHRYLLTVNNCLICTILERSISLLYQRKKTVPSFTSPNHFTHNVITRILALQYSFQYCLQIPKVNFVSQRIWSYITSRGIRRYRITHLRVLCYSHVLLAFCELLSQVSCPHPQYNVVFPRVCPLINLLSEWIVVKKHSKSLMVYQDVQFSNVCQLQLNRIVIEPPIAKPWS